MALSDLLTHQKTQVQVLEAVTPERVQQDLPALQKQIAYWRVYPDRFVDYLCSLNPNSTFKFFWFQRLFIRCFLRYKHCFVTCPRGFSKSFLAVLCLVIKCVLYPGAKVFVVAGGKEQSSGILGSKLNELVRMIPALQEEIIWDVRNSDNKTARTRSTKDSVVYTFKNGSELENIALSEKTRGRRFQAGLIEEIASVDGTAVNEIVLPEKNYVRGV